MSRRQPNQYNWMKLQFDERLLTKHFNKGRAGQTPKFVVVHHMTIVGDGKGKANNACYNVWQARQASAHFGVDGDSVMQFVKDSDTAWANGNQMANRQGIAIEHANSKTGPSWEVSEKTWKNGAKLTAHLHHVYKLGRPVSTNNGKSGTIRKHSSFKATACPGPFIDGIWSQYVKEAQRCYDEIVKPKPKPHVKPKASGEWLTTITWNISLGNAKGIANWLSRRQSVADAIRADNAHIVFLQEAYWATALGHHGLAWLIKQLSNYRIARRQSGRVILVRDDVKILHVGTYAPKAKAKGHPTKYAVFAIVEYQGVRSLVVSAHAQAGKAHSKVRAEWAAELAAMVEASRKWHKVGRDNVILGGDWNGPEVADEFARWGYVTDDANALDGSGLGSKSLNLWNAVGGSGPRIDYHLIPAKRPVIWASQRNDSSRADHNRQKMITGKQVRK